MLVADRVRVALTAIEAVAAADRVREGRTAALEAVVAGNIVQASFAVGGGVGAVDRVAVGGGIGIVDKVAVGGGIGADDKVADGGGVGADDRVGGRVGRVEKMQSPASSLPLPRTELAV